LDLQQEWKKSFGTDLGFPQAGIFVSDDLIRSNPSFVKNYIQVLNEGMDWINENPGKAGEYAEEMELGLPAAVVEKSMPGNNIKHEYVKDIRAALDSFFEALYDFNPDTVGGKVPNDELYYEIQ
jgi:NitT/TauT family transport system substrate-binding protein